ncbi:MAG TPA: hypothetical protein VM432_12780 [Bdellovibrionales bacterium]|jgi:hypothetical protein|nr:hypothetical protein [Bdellovibrionales bacterium]
MKTAILALLFVVTFSTPVVASAGHESGNGGDAVASEFIITAVDLVDRIRDVGETRVRFGALLNAIATTEVHSVDDALSLENGLVVDALNFPKRKLILVNRARWQSLDSSSQLVARLVLVLHEYLGIMGIPDRQYRVSRTIVQAMDLSNYKATWSGIHNPTHFASLRFQGKKTRYSSNLEFDPVKSEELSSAVVIDKDGGWRKVVIQKETTAQVENGSLLVFHTFAIRVFDSNLNVIGESVLKPEDCGRRHCTTGTITVADVTIKFSRF